MVNMVLKTLQISPFYGNLNGLPPLLIQMSSDEVLVFQCKDFARKAKNMDVDVTLNECAEMLHNWAFYNPEIPESQQLFEDIAKFTRNCFQLD